MKGTESNLYF